MCWYTDTEMSILIQLQLDANFVLDGLFQASVYIVQSRN